MSKKKILAFGIIIYLIIFVVAIIIVNNMLSLKNSLTTNYDLTLNKEQILISNESGLGFKKINVDEKDFYILSYLNDENINIDTENDSIKSLNIGEYCVSISGVVLNVNTQVNERKISDLLLDLCKKMGDYQEGSEIIKTSFDTFYILTENENTLFINYITSVENNPTYAIYYRFIIKDVDSLGIEMTDEERVFLHNNLPELLEVLGITDDLSDFSIMEDKDVQNSKTNENIEQIEKSVETKSIKETDKSVNTEKIENNDTVEIENKVVS